MNITVPVTLALLAPLCLSSDSRKMQDAQDKKRIAMQVVDMADVLARHRKSKRAYTRFFKVPSMNFGIYSLKKGAHDDQSPHSQDEVYYVLKGKAKMHSDGRKEPVAPGSFVFVAAGEEHRFVEIEEDLELLVFFSSGALQNASVKKATPKKDGK